MGGWVTLLCSGLMGAMGSVILRRGVAQEEQVAAFDQCTQPVPAQDLVDGRDAAVQMAPGSSMAHIDGDVRLMQVFGRVVPVEGTVPCDLGGEAVVRDARYYSVLMDGAHECSDVLVHAERTDRPFALETASGRVLVDPSGSSLQGGVRSRYVHRHDLEGEASASETFGRLFNTEKEVGYLQTEASVPVGRLAYVLGAVRSMRNSSGEQVFHLTSTGHPNVTYVIGDQPAVGQLQPLRDSARALQYVGALVCLGAVVFSFVEGLIPKRLHTERMAPYVITTVVMETPRYREVIYLVRHALGTRMTVEDGMDALRVCGKIQMNESPVKVEEVDAKHVRVSFVYARGSNWMVDHFRTSVLRAAGWAGVCLAALALVDYCKDSFLKR